MTDRKPSLFSRNHSPGKGPDRSATTRLETSVDNTVPLWQALLIAGVPSLAGFAGVFITVVTS